jgi:predicted 3-demethylubiquinone-9 3-methyltransferase (glyoxalase superfamily)
MQKVTPFLWFDGKAEEAVRLYTSLIPGSKIVDIAYWGPGGPFPPDQVMTATFELGGNTFYAFDAGPTFKFNEAISLSVDCKDQEEVDLYWNKLTADGGEESQCGWLKDKFGLSWQIVPRILPELMQDKDKVKAGRVMQAMMKMKKIIVADIQAAYDGK